MWLLLHVLEGTLLDDCGLLVMHLRRVLLFRLEHFVINIDLVEVQVDHRMVRAGRLAFSRWFRSGRRDLHGGSRSALLETFIRTDYFGLLCASLLIQLRLRSGLLANTLIGQLLRAFAALMLQIFRRGATSFLR